MPPAGDAHARATRRSARQPQPALQAHARTHAQGPRSATRAWTGSGPRRPRTPASPAHPWPGVVRWPSISPRPLPFVPSPLHGRRSALAGLAAPLCLPALPVHSASGHGLANSGWQGEGQAGRRHRQGMARTRHRLCWPSSGSCCEVARRYARVADGAVDSVASRVVRGVARCAPWLACGPSAGRSVGLSSAGVSDAGQHPFCGWRRAVSTRPRLASAGLGSEGRLSLRRAHHTACCSQRRGARRRRMVRPHPALVGPAS